MALAQPCFTDLTLDQQNYTIYESLQQLAGFEIPPYDEIDITYYGTTNNIATIAYSKESVIVATLTLTYAIQPPTLDDARLVNVTIS
jgi:hypothetical protein